MDYSRRQLLSLLGLASAAPLADAGGAEPGRSGPTETGSAAVDTSYWDSEASSWFQESKLRPESGDPGDEFGFSVALSGDGTTALIGARHQDDDVGRAVVFEKRDDVWRQEASLRPESGDPGSEFGFSVALSADGTTALVGARREDGPNDDVGAAYVFGKTADEWDQQARLVPANGAVGDEFGFSVALSGDGETALVGAWQADGPDGTDRGSAWVFERRDGTWHRETRLAPAGAEAGADFGSAVALSGDGETALVGAWQADGPDGTDSGSAWVFERRDGDWSRAATLVPEDGDAGDNFGVSVALSADGTTGLVGAWRDEDPNGRDAGSATVFVEETRPRPTIDTFSLTPEAPRTGERVFIVADASFEAGSIRGYEIDVDGDGEFEVGFSTRTVSHVFREAGTFDVTLKVTTDVETTATVTRPVTVEKSFHPAVHGFGFETYGTVEAPASTRLYEVIRDRWVSAFDWQRLLGRGIDREVFFAVLTDVIRKRLRSGVATAGYSLGMLAAARAYYHDGLPEIREGYPERPEGTSVETAADIEHVPVGVFALAPVERDIERYQRAAVRDPSLHLVSTAVWASFPVGPGSIDYQAQLSAIERAIDDGQLPTITLARSGGFRSRQVLGFRVSNGTVSVYDPEHPGDVGRITVRDGRMQPYEGFDRFGYVPADPTDGLALFEGGVEAATGVLRQVWGPVLTVGVDRDVDLAVRRPDGTRLSTADLEPETLGLATGQAVLSYGFDAPPGTYTIAIQPRETVEYTAEIRGQLADGTVIERTRTGTAKAEETSVVSVGLPEDDAPAGDPSTTSEPATTRPPNSEATTTDRAAEGSTGTDGTALALLGGGAVAGGAGTAALLKWLDGDD